MLCSSLSYAEEVHVITSGGFTEAYRILGPKFEAETGITLVTEYGASSGGAPDSIPMRLARGEPADVIILARYALDDLSAAGYVFPGTPHGFSGLKNRYVGDGGLAPSRYLNDGRVH